MTDLPHAAHDGKITPMVSKLELRASILAARPHSSAGLSNQLIQVAHRFNAQKIASFQSMADEPQLAQFNELMDSERQLLFPRIIGSDLEFAAGEIQPGSFGILEPTASATEDIDLILVPAVAVDRSGNRLGRGRGFYDRALVRFPNTLKLAVVFDEEIVEKIPNDPWDEPVDGIVTPLQTIIFD